jgi:hypothetical protein
VIGEADVEAMIQVALRDASIARVLREICALEGAVCAGALELVGAHPRNHAAAADVLACVQALREDAVARRLAERLGPPG